MSSNELFAAAAHLHVLLRRKTGRVTDTEWMASNPEYARAMVAFAGEVARREGLDDLQHLADKLAGLIPSMLIPVRKPLLAAAAAHFGAARSVAAQSRSVGPEPPVSGFQASRPAFADSDPATTIRDAAPGRRYVGGIR